MVVLVTKSVMTKEQFSDFGWRIPFLFSIVLVAIAEGAIMAVNATGRKALLVSAAANSVNDQCDRQHGGQPGGHRQWIA